MAPSPTGTQHEIADGAYRAVITEVGGGLRGLTHGGRDLVVGFGAGEVRPRYRGSVLAPWPNRVRDGRYSFEGVDQQLDLTEPDRGNALHGLVCWLAWELREATPSRVVLAARVWPQPGYPHALDLEVAYEVADAPGTARDGLTWTVAARNAGASRAPYGTSVHPYLVAGPGRADDWTLDLDAARVLDVDPERLLPRGVLDVTPALDLRGGRPLAGVALDHAYTGVVATGPGGAASAVLRAPDGGGVALHWDAAVCPWVQVHTADRPEPDQDRIGVAVEPMTCPPDALASGTDLVVLEPGATHGVTWRICAVDPA